MGIASGSVGASAFPGAPSPSPRSDGLRGAASYGRLPLYFEENRAPAGEGTRFVSQGSAYTLSLSPGAATLRPRDRETSVRMKWLGGNDAARMTGEDPKKAKMSYIL